MTRTAEMFPKIWTPRRVLMHFDDAGQNEAGEKMANFVCRVCGYRAGWLICTAAEMRGVPCPKCNGHQP